MKIFEWSRLSKGWAALLAGLFLCSGAMAQEQHMLRWHGFFSQGVVHTDDNNFFGDSTDTSFDFRDVGLGFSWKPHTNWLISAQGIYRDAGKTSPDGVNLDYAMLNYSLVNEPEYGAGVRVGRVKNPYAFYNETRDVAATRPSVLLPQSIYPDTFREIFHSSDGVIFYGYRERGNWLFDFNLLAGKANIDENSEQFLVPTSQRGSIDHDRLWGGRGILEYDGGRIRLGFLYIDFKGDIETVPALPPPFGILPGEVIIRTRGVSFEYNWEDWQFTAEYLRSRTAYTDVFGSGVRTSRDSDAYYFQLGYQITEQWRLLSRYDVYYPDRSDKSGRNNIALGLPKSDAFAKDFTVGAQYHFNDAWMLAGDVHHINGTAWLADIENPDRSRLEENWNLYTLQLSYKF